MENDALYMIGIVAAGFAVNFGLRALPFLFFGARRGPLPRCCPSRLPDLFQRIYLYPQTIQKARLCRSLLRL